MNRWAWTLVLPLLLVFAASDARAQQTPVFVTAVQEPAPPRATPDQLEGAVKGAQSRMFEIADGVRKQHGNKRQNWPAEAVDTVVTAENAYNTAIAQRDYYPATTREGLGMAVDDFAREIGKSKALVAVPAADSAALIVEVIGRRTAKTTGVTDARYFIRMRVRPGPAGNPAAFREVSAKHKWGPDFLSKTFAEPTVASALWDVEAGSNASFKLAATIGEGFLEIFAKALSARAR